MEREKSPNHSSPPSDHDAKSPTTTPTPPHPPILDSANEPPTAQTTRFQLELEFVQCLANPSYLQFLAQQQYFSDPTFLNYLAYLRYWQNPTYAKYIVYPFCLDILGLLQHAEFRAACASPDTVKLVHEKEYWSWRTYRKNRLMEEHKAIPIPPDIVQVKGREGESGQDRMIPPEPVLNQTTRASPIPQ